MYQMLNEAVSDDKKIISQSFGNVSTLSDSIIPTLISTNLAYSLAKQGFKTLLLDLNLSQPILGLLFNNNFFFEITTNKIFEQNLKLEMINELAFSKEFSSEGKLTIIPASIDMKSRMKIQAMTNTENKRNLALLMDFMKKMKENYHFIIINMPSGADLRLLTQSSLITDNNFLLIDQNNISIGYGIDLVANLEAIHPLIEFKGLIIYDYKYNVNFIDDERPMIEQAFNLPILVTIPPLPNQDLLILLESLNLPSISIYNYYKFISQELFKYMANPNQLTNYSYNKSEVIEVLIIANNAGIPLFTSYLKGTSDKSTIISQDEILASATLTAIVTGITEVIKELTSNLSGETNLIKQKHLNLVIENDNPLRAMMLSHRNEDDIRSKILIFLNLFKQRFRKEIDSFSGLSKTFKEAQSIVEEVF